MANVFTLIYGPTASGKTALAYRLAREQNANILSFDSRHVYQGMDIVTGKDRDPNFPGQVYGLDLVTPDQEFSIRHFYEYARPIIEEHKQKQHPLILVGGSWPYARVLIEPPTSLTAPRNRELRQQLEQKTVPHLQIMLQSVNPSRWTAMNASDRANPRRLVRAIEIASMPQQTELPPPLLIHFQLHLLDLPLEQLERTIQQRVEVRWANGAQQETEKLMKKYPQWSTQAFDSTGYRLIRQYIEGTLSESKMLELWYLEERQYAKRQKTWLKSLRS